MTGSIGISLHMWRGVGPDVEPDLFVFRFRLGFITVSVCRASLLEAYRKLRRTIERAIDDTEGR